MCARNDCRRLVEDEGARLEPPMVAVVVVVFLGGGWC